MDILVAFVQHLVNCGRSNLNTALQHVLLLEGHASRKGTKWLGIYLKKKCEVLQSPSTTTHFLQPCDQQASKTFQKAMRSLRYACNKNDGVDTRSV